MALKKHNAKVKEDGRSVKVSEMQKGKYVNLDDHSEEFSPDELELLGELK